MQNPSPNGPRTAQRLAGPLVLVASCCLAFAPGLTSPLTQYDDPQYITASSLMTHRGWEGFAAVWNAERAWRGDFIEFFPLRDAVYWLLFQRFGPTGTPFHVASLLLHVTATLMVLLLLRQLRVSSWVAIVAAELFAVHPIHIESVTWAAGLKDPMYTTLMLGSIVAWARWRQSSRPAHYVLSLVLLVASLLTKSLAIVTPLLLVALDRFGPDGPTPWRRLLPRVSGHALVCALFLAQFIAIGRAHHILVGPHGGSVASHLVLAAWAQVLYLRQAIAPVGFRLIYCFSPVTGLGDPRLLGALALLPLLVLAIVRWRSLPLRLFCVCWYLACLLPVSNIVPFPAIVADRYLYAASVGVCLLIAMLVEAAVPRLKTLLAFLMVTTLLLVTAARTAVWQHEEDLWAEADEDPECLEDPALRAALVHLLRFKTTRNHQVAMAALERTSASAVVRNGQFVQFCDSLVLGARMALSHGDIPHATRWAQNAVRTCPHEAWVWNASMQVNLHRAPALAAESAEKAWRLDPGPLTLMLRGLTALEVTVEPEAVQWVLEGVKASPQATCPGLRDWVRAVPPALGESVAEATRVCLPSE